MHKVNKKMLKLIDYIDNILVNNEASIPQALLNANLIETDNSMLLLF